jgi:hypothetical protein
MDKLLPFRVPRGSMCAANYYTGGRYPFCSCPQRIHLLAKTPSEQNCKRYELQPEGWGCGLSTAAAGASPEADSRFKNLLRNMESGDTISAASRLRIPAGALCAPAIKLPVNKSRSAERCSGVWDLRLNAVLTPFRSPCVRNVERPLCTQKAARLHAATRQSRSPVFAFCSPFDKSVSKTQQRQAVIRQEDS